MMQYRAKTRQEYAVSLLKPMLTNMDAAAHFVSIVSNEINMQDLERITIKYFLSLRNIEQKENLKN